MTLALLALLAPVLVAAYVLHRRAARPRWRIISGCAVQLPLPAHPQATPRRRRGA